MKEIIIDLSNKSLGRGAVEVANALIGKAELDYAPNRVPDVKVVVQNLEKVKLDAKKLFSKKYYTHSGYLGSLKESTLEQMWEKDSFALFIKIVRGMLPKNKLTVERIKRIKVAK